MKNRPKILLIQLRQLGDIILTTPCVTAVKEKFPNSHLTFLCDRMGLLVLDGNPLIDEILIFDDRQRGTEQLKTLWQLRSKKFDLVFDFMNNPRSAIATFCSRAPQRWAFESSRSWAYTRSVPKGEGDYIVREKGALLSAAGIPLHDERLVIPTSSGDRQAAQLIIEKLGLSNSEEKPRVLLSPTHRRAPRRWNAERWTELAYRFNSEWNAQVLWLWGPGEETFIDEILNTAPSLLRANIGVKLPPTRFREMAALMKEMDLFVGTSNGPSHVAVAADLASIQLHGHTLLKNWCPMNSRHRGIQSSTYKGPIDLAMQSITVEEVWTLAQQMRPEVLRRYYASAPATFSAP